MTNKEKNFVSTVVYIHNMADRIKGFLDTLIEVMQMNFEHSEIICVNDFSTDDSISVIKEVSLNAKTTNVSIVNLSSFHGIELAMNAGVDLSIGDFVFEFDSISMDYDVNMIMKVYHHSLQGGYDIVGASPEKMEKISSKLFYSVFDKFSNLSYKMTTERFRILSRRAINRINAMNKTIPYRKALYAGCGLKVDNLKYSVKGNPIRTKDTKEKRYRLRLAVDTLILFTEVGYRFSIWMTSLMMLISIFMILYTLVIYFTGHPIEGWTTTVLFLSVAFLGLFGIMTIIVKYLQIIVDMIFKRKTYSFVSIEKITG